MQLAKITWDRDNVLLPLVRSASRILLECQVLARDCTNNVHISNLAYLVLFPGGSFAQLLPTEREACLALIDAVPHLTPTDHAVLGADASAGTHNDAETSRVSKDCGIERECRICQIQHITHVNCPPVSLYIIDISHFDKMGAPYLSKDDSQSLPYLYTFTIRDIVVDPPTRHVGALLHALQPGETPFAFLSALRNHSVDHLPFLRLVVIYFIGDFALIESAVNAEPTISDPLSPAGEITYRVLCDRSKEHPLTETPRAYGEGERVEIDPMTLKPTGMLPRLLHAWMC